MTAPPARATTPLSAWNRLERPLHIVHPITDPRQAAGTLARHHPGIAYGMGRSYGDACLNPGGHAWLTGGLDHLVAFDAATGILQCESGALLRDILRMAIPRGWALPVVPGTQLVTVGGAIANDVHGKNHHRFGSFGDHVLGLRLQRTDGEVIDCGPDRQADWFAATVGGLGLTGLIVEATLQLRRVPGPWLDTETVAFDDLAGFFALSQASADAWEYTVAWIDCIGRHAGRGLFLRANHVAATRDAAPAPARQRRFPFEPPLSLVNRVTLRGFNAAYFHRHRLAAGRRLAPMEAYFHPLDAIGDWNRMYGPHGFYQYQCVVPPAAAADGVREMLREIAQAGQGSFLAVLKQFGERSSAGMLGFPRPGTTLALDFPNLGGPTRALLARLDAIVGAAGGGLYPAKDARMPRSLFERAQPRLAEFRRHRDPGTCSGLSRRLIDLPA